MNDQVRTIGDGPGEHSRRDGVVDNQVHVGRVGDVGHRGKVGDVPHWIRGSLDQISRVRPGRIERSTASRSLESMNSTSRPHVNANSASHFRTPQYNTRETSSGSLGTSDWKIAVVAAIPGGEQGTA